MTRVLIAGSGVAGLAAALAADAAGAEVEIVTKADPAAGSTWHAQGGIACPVDAGDRAAHARDTMVASAGLADARAVAALVDGSAGAVRALADAGVAFDRDAAGALARGREGAHSRARILHAGGDATGRAISRALLHACHARGIRLLSGAMVAELLLDRGRARGALLTDGRILEADAVILATGGIGEAYPTSTNPAVATGDGIAVALRAGARVADMEFVQFHPTVLARGGRFLVSEAVRGEGARLVDRDGRPVMAGIHPAGDLAPRDAVARALARVEARQGGVPALLDATGLGRAFLARRFPTIDAATRRAGLDWAREPIPVSPAQHYLMGGVVTDLDGRTTVAGLWAAGETARTGVHGANRLASNSLLEGAVFGARAGRDAATATLSAPRRPDPVPPIEAEGRAFARADLQAVMWAAAGLFRDARGLADARRTLDAWGGAGATQEDRNLLAVARAVVDAAARRRGSVGAHARTDDDARAAA
ncbi:L-aspartate oxidase [Microbacterium excoecariae]|uniref:L-aspartate oxidase n=1 Tax=Microbacterium excoecariae TaxID=2715210 RepID=UPI001F0F4431|nr:L-aspartate oxidase [Microbacterium excoecariae]NHI17334.1 L-aspartate oxidase [Microbacterium excoecariae]